MLPSTVENVFSKGFTSVSENDTLSKCLKLFRKGMPPVLAVLDNDGKYKGVLARRWVIRSRLDPSRTKVKKLMRPAPAVAVHDSLSKAARLMIESEVRQLPVYRDKKFLGFVTDEDIIHGAVIDRWGSTHVEDIMTKKPFAVEEDESVGAVLDLFREQGISHAPIVKDGKLVGLVSIQDIIEHIYKPRLRQTVGEIVGEKVPVLSIPAKGIMSRPVITILPESGLRAAIEKMHEFDISSLIVVKKGRSVGILTKRDLLEPIAQMEKEPLEFNVQFSVKNVELDSNQRGFIIGDFESFARRYGKTFKSGTLFVYMKAHGADRKGDQLVHCRLQLRTVKGSFFSSGQGFGLDQTFRLALDRLESQILRCKKPQYHREFTKKYLRRIRFPLTEL